MFKISKFVIFFFLKMRLDKAFRSTLQNYFIIKVRKLEKLDSYEKLLLFPSFSFLNNITDSATVCITLPSSQRSPWQFEDCRSSPRHWIFAEKARFSWLQALLRCLKQSWLQDDQGLQRDHIPARAEKWSKTRLKMRWKQTVNKVVHIE